MKPVNIYPSRLKNITKLLVFVILGGLCFFAGSNKFVINFEPLLVKSVLYVGVSIFGILSLYVLIGLLIGKNAISISNEGIEDSSTFIKYGLIPWIEIDRIFYERSSNKDYLCVALKKPETFLKNQPLLKRMFSRKMARDAAFIRIPQSALPVKPGEIIKEIRTSHPEVRIHYPFPHFGEIEEKPDIANNETT